VELRQFALNDARQLYAIRNHHSVRRFMSKPALIPYKQHVQWVRNQLIGNENFLLFLVRTKPAARAIGIAQLRVNGRSAEIGVIFRDAPKHQIVTVMATMAMLQFAFLHLELLSLVSYVVPTHTAAIEYNKMFGASEEDSEIDGMVKLRLGKDVYMDNENVKRFLRRIKNRLLVLTDSH
jgi:RimJ/RimL family protein N-acetyltransferase